MILFCEVDVLRDPDKSEFGDTPESLRRLFELEECLIDYLEEFLLLLASFLVGVIEEPRVLELPLCYYCKDECWLLPFLSLLVSLEA